MRRNLLVTLVLPALFYLTGCQKKAENQQEVAAGEEFDCIYFDTGGAEIEADGVYEKFETSLKSLNMGKDDFWKDKENFFMHAWGALEVAQDKEYHFRIESNGKVIIRLNNKPLFSMPEFGKNYTSDQSMYLHEGINLLEVLYYDGGMEPKLILSWSEDGNEYKIIPEEFYRKGDVSFEVSSLPIEESDQDIEPNVLSEEEIAEGWKLLYDGKTTDGWHTFNQPGTIGSKWTSKDGALNFEGRESFRYMLGGRMMEMGSGNKSEDGGLDIVSDETFENFELKLDWKISYGGNSGITYTTLEGNEYGEIWHTSPEMQVLHDQVHKDGVIYTHRSGDLYDLIAADPVVVKPQGEWNRIKIVKDHGKIQHWMNGYKVVEYDTNTDEWTEMISKSKFSEFVNYASPGPGHIGLQDHGNEVSFRNIKIRVLE